MKAFKTIVASIALAGTMLAQPALAETRSYQSLPQSGVKAVERVGAVTGESDEFAGPLSPVVIIFIVFGVLLGLGFATGIFDNDSAG